MDGKGVIMVIVLASAFADRMIGQGVPPVIDSCAFGSCHHLEVCLYDWFFEVLQSYFLNSKYQENFLDFLQ